ncbi:MAG: glycosyltransferase [Gammaproteobacteria bacterium]
MIDSYLVLPAVIMWLTVLLLPWQPWRMRERFDLPTDWHSKQPSDRLAQVTVLIPARNETGLIATTLHGLATQSASLEIIIIDDQSTDGTADQARETADKLGLESLHIITTPPLPGGWSGKLWALEQGRLHVNTKYVLMLDADIEMMPGVLSALLTKLEDEELHMLSLMVRLRMQNGWEKLLMPAFIYFFRLLYPFALSNRPNSRIAAAAGGCILLRADTLTAIGGFASLRGALIDDCSLAAKVKARGQRIWLGLTHAAVSQRRYECLGDIWQMITRTAYAQLRYSPALLLLCLLLLGLAFAAPLYGLTAGPPALWLALAALIMMLASYAPTLRYYGISGWYMLTLPLAAILFACMTVDSARQHRTGRGNIWKDRVYVHENPRDTD